VVWRDDARFSITRYIEGKIQGTDHEEWIRNQRERFRYILVDEF
jgi:hypothetical protein